MHRKEAGSLVGAPAASQRALMIVLGFTMGGSLYFYTFTTYMQKYLVNTAHMDPKTVSTVMTGRAGRSSCACSRRSARCPIASAARTT